jgi:hypothetical protein
MLMAGSTGNREPANMCGSSTGGTGTENLHAQQQNTQFYKPLREPQPRLLDVLQPICW